MIQLKKKTVRNSSMIPVPRFLPRIIKDSRTFRIKATTLHQLRLTQGLMLGFIISSICRDSRKKVPKTLPVFSW